LKVLVTGATGFTGGRLATALAARGHEVRALVRPRSISRFEGSDAARAGVQSVEGELTTPSAVAAACVGIEVVYHIAAMYREAGHRAAAYRDANVEGTRHVLEAALSKEVRRVVHCSTGGVHGHIVHPPADEEAPFNPGDIYQETKLEGERLAGKYAASAALEVVIARPIGIYGPGDTRFLKLFRGIARGRFPMLGSGRAFYHLTFIDDLVEGLRLCGETPAARGRTYILAGPEYTTLGELVALVASELGVRPPRLRLPVWPVWVAGLLCEALMVPLGLEPPLHRRRVDFYTKSRAFSTARARSEIGYNPHVDLRTGIRLTIEWYRGEGLL